ncbi:hypothetical protein SADO_15179 [Salinisphaera dokdonensis CL-ES53]|uniref:Uncharacterized protein n=1 Tax=Salinisphaera dokdonensis CL-ES53 TaxID=1304272 RepID=A0ABV2B3Z6_9GAMM
MKTPRSIGTRAACALLLAAGAAGVFAFTYIDRAPQPSEDSARIQAAAPPKPAAPKPSVPTQTAPAAAEPASNVALRLDDATDLQPSEPPRPSASRAEAHIAANGVDVSAAGDFVESDEPLPGLNLQVPEDAAGTELLDTRERKADKRATPAKPATSNIALNAEGEVEVNPEVESFSVFNPEYGLRGFMKQNWINQRVALQGGFGLDDDRLDQTGDDDIRDNIAVGMGLILAF